MKKNPEYDSKRQQNVLLERIHSDVRIIHGVLVRNMGEIKGILNEHKGILIEHDRRFDRIEMAVTENTKDIKILKAGQERIEQKLDLVTINHEQRIQKLEAAH